MLYELKLDHNAVEATKINCCVKDGGAVDHSTVTIWFKKFCLCYKNLNYQAMSDMGNLMTYPHNIVEERIAKPREVFRTTFYIVRKLLKHIPLAVKQSKRTNSMYI